MVGRKEKFGSISAEKLGARLASPQPRPASPVNGAGGITGCGNDAQAFGSFQPGPAFFQIFSRPIFVPEMAYFEKPWASDRVDE